MKRNGLLLLAIILCAGCGSETVSYNGSLIEGRGIVCKNGIVVSAHPQSSRIGAEVLRKGGNAIDAAVATEFALAVCYPEAGNIGGGGFMLVRMNDGVTDLIDYREKAPNKAFRDMYLDNKGTSVEGLSTDTHLASGVPGTVDGMINAHTKYGKLPFVEVIQPAIDLAEYGYALTKEQASSLNTNRFNFISRNPLPPAFVKDSLWKEGDLLVQKELAGTLKRIRDMGRDGFYSGLTAELIQKEMARGNGIISEIDLSSYRSVSRVPLVSDYRGFKILTVPPPSSGGIILIQLLKMVEPYSLGEFGFHSVNSIHLMVEAERRAFADRSEYMGDPDYMKIGVDELTNKKYLKVRMADFNSESASSSQSISPGNPDKYVSEETTHYSVVDQYGNAVSATTTLNGTFGTGIVVNGAGFLLNNQMDDFSVKPGVPNMYGLVGGEINSVQPGKRMLSSMCPVIVEKGGKLFLVVGSPGGSTIPTTVFQIITNVIDFNMNILDAVDTSRFHHQWLPDWISIEKSALNASVERKLINMGHNVKSRQAIGRVNAVMINNDGEKCSGADKRGNNSAYGF